MRDFFKFMLASMVGFLLSMIIILAVFALIIAAIVSVADSGTKTIPAESLLHITLDQPIEDRTPSKPFYLTDWFTLEQVQPGLCQTLEMIGQAAEDEKIRGILLEMGAVPSGIASLQEIRKALLEFKKSGKFIYAYGERFSQKGYLMASVADSIFLNPEGAVDFRGLIGQTMFISKLLGKLEINPQIIRHGKYKSAVEPLILEKMSEANREQLQSMITSVWDFTLENISESREIGVTDLNETADKLLLENSHKALEMKFVDSLLYKDQLLDLLSARMGTDKMKGEQLVSLQHYSETHMKTIRPSRSQDRIAVIFATGEISGGEGSDEGIGSESLSRAIRKARLDKRVKAILIRVNSPGGDALASEVIWREVSLARESKPVVVSMGNLAASGGYYISCAATRIFADPGTLTGSIGVFGVVPDMRDFFDHKLGITFDEVKTNEHSDFISISKPMPDYQHEVLQQSIEQIYKTFVSHVSESRNLSFEEVDSIGQGRVWSGIDAVKIGLVDELGGMNEALEAAANIAGITDYRIIHLPEQKDVFEQIMEDFSMSMSGRHMKSEMGEYYPYFEMLRKTSGWKGIQARLPFEISIE